MVFTKDTISDNLQFISHKHELGTFQDSVKQGLGSSAVQRSGVPYSKQLSCYFFYDELGSQLFEQITSLQEYYLTRCELSVLKDRADTIAQRFKGKDNVIVELGSGSSMKTDTILDAFVKLGDPVQYVPIDISRSILEESAQRLTNQYKGQLEITVNHGLYQQGINYVATEYAHKSKLILFLGSSIGNFTREEAVSFLTQIRTLMSPSDRLLIGIDLRKDKSTLEAAYNDSQGVTSAFNLNLLDRINRELGGHFDLTKFEHTAIYDEKLGFIQMFLRALEDQDVSVDKLEMTVHFDKGELIHTENSVKYSKLEIDTLATSAGFEVEELWLDNEKRFSLSLFAPSAVPVKRNLELELREAWKFSDTVFSLLQPDAFCERPISLRHPFVFYLGHLPAFAHNQVCNYVLQNGPSFNAYFDNIFERGIDPSVDSGTCHTHSEVPPQWPTVQDVLEYRSQVRNKVLEATPASRTTSSHIMALKGRVFSMVTEHEYMHGETLLYMYGNLMDEYRQRPVDSFINYKFGKCPISKAKMITIPEGMATLGADFHQLDFGWDNEFPTHEVYVPSFKIDELPVTNGEFLQFVRSKEYENPQWWANKDWKWKENVGLEHPHYWKYDTERDAWFVLTVFGDAIPIDKVFDWPVYVSHAEASAYAKWKGKRLPTEAEFHRAAYGKKDTKAMNPFPWGSENPLPGVHGNFHFYSWAPTPVGSFPRGVSEYGCHDMIGNGWEWTSSLFEPYPGYNAYIPEYPGYSADFFDGEHYVMLGASWATAVPLIRRSFRNWFQSHYQYTFSKFRCVSDVRE